jgi:hypothetical protein
MRLLGDIGTIEWCRATNGILSGVERRRFIAAVLLETARSTPRLLLSKAGVRGKGGADPSVFCPPDTPFTRRVIEACAHLDPMLIQHGYRSYLFARALGALENLSCDDEALFIAAILHDYAFPSPDRIDDRCFTLVGAEVAADLLREAPLSEALQHDVLDGITLHLNPRVPPRQGILQHLLHDAILIDTVGVRAWDLDKKGMQRVVERHPRHGFIHRGSPRLRAHAAQLPSSRARQIYRCGFSAALRLGPWYAHEARILRDGPHATTAAYSREERA